MRTFPALRFAALLVTAGTVTLAVQSHRAYAGWPPAPGDDLTNPANWPNDPDYKSRWNYWSFLPTQQAGTPAYLSADKTLGASGMSVDKAWELSSGTPPISPTRHGSIPSSSRVRTGPRT